MITEKSERMEEDNITFQITPSDRKKVHLGFFALRALKCWEMALVFHYFLGKFGLNIFPI